MNLAQHLDKIINEVGLPDVVNPTTRFLIDAIDDAETNIVSETHVVRTSNIFDSVDNTPTYSLATYLPKIVNYHIDSIYYSTTDSTERRPLTLALTSELDFNVRDWRETDNLSPGYYYIDKEKGTLGISPYEKTVKTGTNCIEAVYRSTHTKMETFYTTGDISITKGLKAVTGVGTAFLANISAGDEIGIGKLLDDDTAFPKASQWYTVDAVTADDALTITTAFAETTVAGGSYIASSVSSITNEALNRASVLIAIAKHFFVEKEYQLSEGYETKATALISKENARIKKVYDLNRINIPDDAMPYPGNVRGDYRD